MAQSSGYVQEQEPQTPANEPSMLASAIVLPESEHPDSTRTPTGATKRRQSPTPDPDSNKRPRTDSEPRSPRDVNHTVPGDSASAAEIPSAAEPSLTAKAQNGTVAKEDGAAGPQRRRSAIGGADEERKRGKRLFGGLLGTLSQSSASKAQKRRDDIDKKQQAKLRMQEEEREAEKKRKRDALDGQRAEEMRGWEEKSIRIRHENARAMAHFLVTVAEPKLYYKPWDLLPRQEESVDKQIADVDKDIGAELETLGMKPDPGKDDETALSNAQMDGGNDAGDTQTVGPNHEAKADTTAALADSENKTTTEPAETMSSIEQATDAATKETVEDIENEEMVVEAGEDPVIY